MIEWMGMAIFVVIFGGMKAYAWGPPPVGRISKTAGHLPGTSNEKTSNEIK